MTTTKDRISMESARIFAGMTREEACTAIGVKLPQLAAWETGNSVPSYEHAAKMAEVYGMTLDTISFQKEDNAIEFDNSYLRDRILDKYPSLDKFAAAVKMNPETLKSRLSANGEFTIGEMERICRVLNVKGMEIERLFFTPNDDPVMAAVKTCITMAKDLTSDELDLLMNIMALAVGNPARKKFALEWKGKMKDLPAALAQI